MEPFVIAAQFLAGHWKKDADFKTEMLRIFRLARAGTVTMFCVKDDDHFRAAVGAAMLSVGPEDKTWIEQQMDGIKMFSAFIAANQAGLTVNPEGLAPVEENRRGYALMGLWHESAARATSTEGA